MISFALRLISETATTITLGWDPPRGVEWYLFFADGKRVANASPTEKSGNLRTAVKFAKGSDVYQVVAVVKV